MSYLANMLRQENAEKKKAGHGWAHRKHNSRKVTLPSDYLTPKQWKERNGKVFDYKLNARLSWLEVYHMPDDLRREYITRLRDKYAVGTKDLAEMFGKNPSYLSSMLTSWGVPRSSRRAVRSENEEAAWQAFLRGEAVLPAEAEPVQEQMDAVVAEDAAAALTSLSFTLVGDMSAALAQLHPFLAGRCGRITVTFTEGVDG